ncbi:MAG: BPL-N domain-containing protein [Desulfovibrionaceae bacterium]|nr:BPL-N domain-containing protein [Desulfovibrionaceae bacterium]
MPPIAMLWDSSHIWGFMSLRALQSLGFPVRLLKGRDIAQGALFRKTEGTEPCRLLVVPGGSAGLKREALGDAGVAAVREFIRKGGRYLGFCGGAGLALSHSRGLGLCPWIRADYPQRILHLVSGYTLAEPCPGDMTPDWQGRRPSLPVWWPGRFSNSGGDVDVLARYHSPDRNFWIADIALETVPVHVFGEWNKLYGVNLTGDFLAGTELMVRGEHGEGTYVLSYSHLETPDSPDANAWLAHILERLTGARVERSLVPAWDMTAPLAALRDGLPASLRTLAEGTRELIGLGTEHRLFFPRTSWLMGWKPGVPGSLCNNLMACVSMACSLEPNEAALSWWSGKEAELRELSGGFFVGAEGYLLAARLADTLLGIMPAAVDRKSLAHERDRLFGHPMLGRGLLGDLIKIIEEYIYLCLAPRNA